MADPDGSGPFAHMVYFSLKERSPQARQRLVAACQKFLADHPGTEHFSVGTLSDMQRDVNDRQFDVALNLVFTSRAAHDQYQQSDRHQQFIAQQRENWSQVRVFDSDIV
jgi:hypothetical protein